MTASDARAVVDGFQKQIAACRALGSMFSAQVLEILATDYAKQGPVYALARSWGKDVVNDAMTLRLLGGLHRLVMTGKAPRLAGHYPSQGGQPGPSFNCDVIQTVSEHHDVLAQLLQIPPQTNEIGRSMALLGGFLEIARRTKLPLRLREIGASAGLNLLWGLYRYDTHAFSWGSETSAATIRSQWDGGAPDTDSHPVVEDRKGCDIAPIDIHDEAACTSLKSFVWADQPDRQDRLDQAIKIARSTEFSLVKASADEWLRAELEEIKAGSCMVIFHSIMWQYMPQTIQSSARGAIEHAGARATDAAPLAWLSFEPHEDWAHPEVRLKIWPGGEERVLGTGHPHGAWITWGESA